MIKQSNQEKIEKMFEATFTNSSEYFRQLQSFFEFSFAILSLNSILKLQKMLPTHNTNMAKNTSVHIYRRFLWLVAEKLESCYCTVYMWFTFHNPSKLFPDWLQRFAESQSV